MMIAQELINHMIPPLKMTDKAEKAITWMEELRVNQLAVIQNGEYKGLISEDIILENSAIVKYVGDFELKAKQCFVYHYQHFYDILKVGTDCGIQVIAVLDSDNKYKIGRASCRERV